jgi:hemerythrin
MALVYVEQVEYVDVEQMQQTHENEIKLLNEIDKLAVQYEMHKTGREELEKKLDTYIAHVEEHFEYEEELMEEYDFPSFDMHKLAHDMFLVDLRYAKNSWKRSGDLEKIIYFIRKTPEWIIMHISTVDAPTATYLAGKMKAG